MIFWQSFKKEKKMTRNSMLTISSVLMILIFSGCATNFDKSSKTLNAMGYEYYKKGQYDKAINEYNKALKLNPQNFEAYVNRGNVYEAMKRHWTAIRDYDRAIEINPNYGRAYMNKGVVYAKMKLYNQAISNISKGIEIDPKNGEMYFNRAVTYFENYEFDKAGDDVNKAQNLGWEIHPGFLQDLRNASDKKYIKIKVPDSVFAGGKVKFPLFPGDILEVIQIKLCLDGKGECWVVREIKTGETGFVKAGRMKNRHYIVPKNK
jgi:tetratricopeptide (TPR) repeat protein